MGPTRARTFKTAWFAKVARKAGISDPDLCDAMRDVMNGRADDLGGGVYKKRLGRNRFRSIVLARGGRHWFYQYQFAKKDRANINEAELADFRVLAKAYSGLSEGQIARLLNDEDLTEICHAEKS